MKITYLVTATVQYDAEIEVEAESELEAELNAEKEIKNFYMLHAIGGPHDPDNVQIVAYNVKPA